MDGLISDLHKAIAAKEAELSDADAEKALLNQRLEALGGQLKKVGDVHTQDDAKYKEYKRTVADLVLEAAMQTEERASVSDYSKVPVLMKFRVFVDHQTSFGVSGDNGHGSIISLSRDASVRDLVKEACLLWALNEDSVLAMLDGAVLNNTARLADINTGCLVTTVVLKTLQEKPEPTMRDPLLDDGTLPVRNVKEPIDLMKEVGEEQVNCRVFYIEGRRYSFQPTSEKLRDLFVYCLFIVLFVTGYVIPMLQSEQFNLFNDVTRGQEVVSRGGNTVAVSDFFSIRDGQSIWNWVKISLTPEVLRSVNAKVSGGNVMDPNWVLDYDSAELIGTVRFRQLRVRANATCTVSKKAENFFPGCYKDYSEDVRAVNTFGPPNVQFTSGYVWWGYPTVQQEADVSVNLDYCTYGSLQCYPNNGYVIDIGTEYRDSGNLTELIQEWWDKVNLLSNNDWIDSQTSAVIISYNTFVGPKALYRTYTYVFEQKLAGEFVSQALVFEYDASTVFPRGGGLIPVILLGLCMLLYTIQKLFHLRYYLVVKGSCKLLLQDTFQVLDWLMLISYYLVLGFQLGTHFRASSTYDAAWENQSTYLTTLGVQSLMDGFRYSETFLTLFLFLRVILHVHQFGTGRIIVNALWGTIKSLFVLIFVMVPFFACSILLIWQLKGSRSEEFKSYSASLIDLTVNLFDIQRQGALEISSGATVVDWYLALLVSIHYFVGRLVFPSLAAVFAIHAFIASTTEHKQIMKRIQKLREEAEQHQELKLQQKLKESKSVWASVKTAASNVLNVKRALKIGTKEKESQPHYS
uniref:Polycystin domain-containing protein n=1 Tax=Mucochytrium quahogii TaxID=96639 RepID=A0A7S2RH39_9STRA|mmetsp:Transcript_15128/g.32335  ORF Transcript_15128/g.32335 Transcript_15128/m.32335 type:complete len:803 (+) Transcript_15128:203-2611(+)